MVWLAIKVIFWFFAILAALWLLFMLFLILWGMLTDWAEKNKR